MSSGLSFDGTFFSGNEAKPEINVTAKEMEVPNRLKSMLDDKTMAPNSLSLSASDVLPGFFGKKYALVLAGNYVEAQIEEKAPAGFNWTMLPLLKGTNQNQASGPQTLSVARQSKHQKEAMDFIAYYAKAENLAKIAQGDALIPVRPRRRPSSRRTSPASTAGTPSWTPARPSSTRPGPRPTSSRSGSRRSPRLPTRSSWPGIDSATLQKRLTDGWNKVNS